MLKGFFLLLVNYFYVYVLFINTRDRLLMQENAQL